LVVNSDILLKNARLSPPVKLEGDKTAQGVTEFMEEAEKRILKLEATALERLMAADETSMAAEGDDVEGFVRGGDGGWGLGVRHLWGLLIIAVVAITLAILLSSGRVEA
jgi:hypothetical protein